MRRTRTEVAALLPTGAATSLLHAPPAVQSTVVDVLGDALDHWEHSGITFDPVQLDAVIEALVAVMLSCTAAYLDHVRSNPLLWSHAAHARPPGNPPQPMA
jgi:hypothetical protein